MEQWSVQRLTIGQNEDHAVASLEWMATLPFLHSRLREHLRRGAKEILRARLERGRV